MTTVQDATDTETTHRDRFIADLRRMADWLEANPDVPIDRYDSAYLQNSPDVLIPVPDRRAYVDRAAAAMGVAAIETECGYYEAFIRFGQVSYRSVSCKPDGEPTESETTR